jgi:hypothetical protein
MHPGSLGSDVAERIRDCQEVIKEGFTLVEIPENKKSKLRNRAVANEYLYCAMLATAQQQGLLALRCSSAAFVHDPTLRAAKQVVKALIGPRLVERLRHRFSSDSASR